MKLSCSRTVIAAIAATALVGAGGGAVTGIDAAQAAPNSLSTSALSEPCDLRTTGGNSCVVTPATQWTDTAGNRMQAHGAGIFTVGSTYYLVGEDKTAGSTFTAVACYSSTDLVHWTRQQNALSRVNI